MENVIKELRKEKATGDDDVSGDVLKLLGKAGLKNNEEIDQHHSWNSRVAQGLHGCYNDCLKEEATSYKMQGASHNQPYRTHREDINNDT